MSSDSMGPIMARTPHRGHGMDIGHLHTIASI